MFCCNVVSSKQYGIFAEFSLFFPELQHFSVILVTSCLMMTFGPEYIDFFPSFTHVFAQDAFEGKFMMETLLDK